MGLRIPAPSGSLEKYNTIAVLNRVTDEVIFQSNFCLMTGASWSIKSRTTVTEPCLLLVSTFWMVRGHQRF